MDQQLILDRYRPLEELAKGGFAEVVLAYDTRMQRRVAIKRLLVARGGSSHPAPAGLAEARTAALLSHPNIVTVHEWDTDADEAFIIMEYVDGVSLADILDSHGPVDLDEAAAIVTDVAAALQHAHDNGILHLDIKPENVLVTRSGRAKVTDFGVAALSTLLGHGPAVGGTLGFMPLEQLHGDDVDERTDVWAFAALCFELLTDANPFSADTIEAAVFKAEVIDPSPPGEFDKTLPPAIDDILLAALATFPRDRYGSIADFAERLLEWLGDPEVGRKILAESVAALAAEDHEGARLDWDLVGLWDRTRPWAGAAVRMAAGGLSGWLAWVGLAEFALTPSARAVATGIAALAGLAAPPLGMALGLLAFALGLGQAMGWLAGIAFACPAAIAWWYAGRRDSALLGSLAAPPLGLAKMAPAAPLLAGFAATPLVSAVAGASAAALAMLASAASGGRAPYLDVSLAWFADPLGTRIMTGNVSELFSTPAPYIVALAWASAATVMSLACRRASRPLAVLGWFLGTLLMYAGYSLADVVAYTAAESMSWTGDALLPHLTASSILVVLVIAAGAPPRAEEE